MMKRIWMILGILALTLVGLPGAATPAAPALAIERCFPETGYCIEGRIREFWEANGGLDTFGYPTGSIGPQVVEGKTVQAQWFERERLELHPENARPYDVLLGRLGVDRLAQLGRTPTPPVRGDPRCELFTDTGHTLCEPFRTYFMGHGLDLDIPGVNGRESLALFGFPVGEAVMESNDGGQPVLTQWFERARMEYHPENPLRYRILLGLLGNEVRGAAPPPATPVLGTPPDWLGRLNAYRQATNLAPVTEDPALSAAAQKHVAYMLLNPDDYKHDETPGAPGYSADGQRAAQQSNLFQTGPGFTAAAAIDGWMESNLHRFGMLRPDLTRTGFALACDSHHCGAALNVLAATDGSPRPEGVVYPGDGQEVNTGLISWQFGPFDPVVTVDVVHLYDPTGHEVPVTILPATGFFNIISLKINAPLVPHTRYSANMTLKQNGKLLNNKIWSFNTPYPPKP